MAFDPTVQPEGLPTWSRERLIDHYGGAPDKENSQTEGDMPYAWMWYSMLKDSRGSVYRQEQDGLVHCENLALARSSMAVTRAAEKLSASSEPVTSDETLGRWAKTLNIAQRKTDTMHSLRARCAAKRMAVNGSTRFNIEASLTALLGERYVRIWTQEGSDLATPPTQTFWPVINPGPAAYSLGGGAWLSERCHLVVEVLWTDDLTQAQFLELMNVHLFHHLDTMLPSYATFDWALGLSGDGLTLDLDDLDFTGMI